MNQAQMASLINISALFVVLPMLALIGAIIYIVLNSPIGAPWFRWRAESHFKAKRFEKAAKAYEKLHHMQELVEGPVYGRKAALSHEMSGKLREAIRWYERSEDWPKMGQLLMEAGDHARAAEVFEAHDLPARLALCYEEQENYIAAGEVYELRLHNFHRAEQQYRRAGLSTDPETTLKARLLLARVQHQLGRREEAQSAFAVVHQELDSSVQYQEFPELQALRTEVRQLLEQS